MLLFYFMYRNVLPACISAVHTTYVHSGRGRQKRALDTLDVELQTVVSHLCGCWKRSPGPLEEQSALMPTKPSLQPLFLFTILPFFTCWCECGHTWKSDDNLVKFILIFYLGSQTQAFRVGGKMFLPPEPSCQPWHVLLFNKIWESKLHRKSLKESRLVW